MLAGLVEVVLGVDTREDTHTAAARERLAAWTTTTADLDATPAPSGRTAAPRVVTT
ncbi:hypothetical protein WDZ17_09490 [Pseudokineococcus basanitobsidens]|uniref:Uncharacterized protein n=1 Tax=Pseudokineococcus basanitobsidens TaxID=1926649 RepID=A0ABU8RK89_9ACTN